MKPVLYGMTEAEFFGTAISNYTVPARMPSVTHILYSGDTCIFRRPLVLRKDVSVIVITQEEPPDIPAWNIGRATRRLSEDESFGNSRGTLTRHPMNISQVYRECSWHGTSTKQ